MSLLEKKFLHGVRRQAEDFSVDVLRQKGKAIRARLFRQQIEAIDDPAQFKTLLSGRRTGKSTTAAAYLFDKALTRPGSSSIYITLTRGTAKRIMWHQLKRLVNEFELGVKWNNTDLVGYVPNQSMIQLAGADTQADIDKFRGVAFDLVIIDECKSFPTNIIDELIAEVITPCLADRMGTLVMMGTPGAILSGTFYQATRPGAEHSRPWDQRNDPKWEGRPYLWSNHTWTLRDNVAMPHLWEAALALKERNRWRDDNPIWLREWLGQWISDDQALVYRYSEERNGYTPDPEQPYGIPEGEGQDWKFVMGLDLGYDDDFSLQVAAYSETCEQFYQVYEYSSPGLTIGDVARKIKEVQALFDIDVMVGDRAGLGKQIFATLEETYELHIEATNKTDKRDFIEILNSELLEGRAKIMKDSRLAMEMTYLHWDEAKRKEDPAAPNNNCDAFLYLWRHSLHHFARKPATMPAEGSTAYWHDVMARDLQRVIERRMKEEKADPYDDGQELDPIDDNETSWRKYLDS